MQLITEAFLRALCLPAGGSLTLPAGAKLSPLAEEYAREHELSIVQEEMPVAESHSPSAKPEDMTHLDSSTLVPKTHPRIRLRGKLDSLEALILLTMQDTPEQVRKSLEEIYAFVQTILGSEVKGTPLPPISLLGMDSAGLRYASHHPQVFAGMPHPVPHGGMGELCLRLNYLRTQVRETELCAAEAFTNGSRPDLIEALNRLSSAVYLIFLRELTR
jgi:ethanolamine utilization cobalamin adenosyltransferase